MSDIRTDRLVLRPLDRGYAAPLAEHLGQYEVTKWLARVPHPYSEQDAIAFLGKNAGQRGQYHIFQGDTLIGGVGTAGHLGYWLAPSAWGQGIAIEAASAALDAYFAQEQNDDIKSGFFEGNVASEKVLTRLGFQPAGRSSVYNTAKKAVLPQQDMRLTRSDWLACKTLRIETPRLVLDALYPSDAYALSELAGIPDIARMLWIVTVPFTEIQARRRIAMARFFGHLGYRLAIRYEGKLIGDIGIGSDGPDTVPDLMYWIGKPYWGQGFITEAARAFMADVTERFNLTEVEAGAFTDNPASAQVLQKLGFDCVGQSMFKSAARLEPEPIFTYRWRKSEKGSSI